MQNTEVRPPHSQYTQKLVKNVSDMNVRPKILKPFEEKWNKFA
jgi:hypothetical protein